MNNETAGFYYHQYLTTVTLASGSTAVIASQAATNLGLVASGVNASSSKQETKVNLQTKFGNSSSGAGTSGLVSFILFLVMC